MKNKYAIESLSMDLMRVAIGYHRGSTKMAQRFSQEALKRKEEIDTKELRPYFKKKLSDIPSLLNQKDKDKLANDALMYSVISKNYSKIFA